MNSTLIASTPDAPAPPPPSFLALVEARMRRALAFAPPGAQSPVELAAARLALASGAKRARPMLIQVLAGLTDTEPWAAIDFAASVELIHTASLLHDDVLDGADLRRGRPSANAEWGNTIAVLAGDMVLTAALQVLRPYGSAVMDKAVDTIAEMTRAVAVEVLSRRGAPLTLPAWADMAEGKTAALFGLGAWLVAWPSERASRLDRALRHLGVAFQIADDAAELRAAPDTLETPGQDFLAANPNFAVSWFLSSAAPGPAAATLTDLWRAPTRTPADIATVTELLLDAGALPAAHAAIGTRIDAARTCLGPDLDHPASRLVLAWADTLTKL